MYATFYDGLQPHIARVDLRRSWFFAGKQLASFDSGHTNNVFQAIMKPGDESVILSCAADGKVNILLKLCLEMLPLVVSSSLSEKHMRQPSTIIVILDTLSWQCVPTTRVDTVHSPTAAPPDHFVATCRCESPA